MTIFAIVVGLILILQGSLGIGGAKFIGRIPFIATGVIFIVTPFIGKQVATWVFVGTVVAVIAISFAIQYWVERRLKRRE